MDAQASITLDNPTSQPAGKLTLSICTLRIERQTRRCRNVVKYASQSEGVTGRRIRKSSGTVFLDGFVEVVVP